MTRTKRSSPISFSMRKKTKNIEFRKSDFLDPYRDLINSFTKKDFLEYEKLRKKFGSGQKRIKMLEYCAQNNIEGTCLEMAKIRSDNLYVHQKLLQIIKYRWTNVSEHNVNRINQNNNVFWNKMAKQIQDRCKEFNRELHSDWIGKEGKMNLSIYLSELYKKQNGLCAISNEPMLLTVGLGKRNDDKCSPDRKNSKLGYVPNNMWLVTTWINTMKMDMPLKIFYNRIDIITNYKIK